MSELDKIQNDIYNIKRDIIKNMINGDEFEAIRLNLVLKRRMRALYEYNIREQKKSLNIIQKIFYKFI